MSDGWERLRVRGQPRLAAGGETVLVTDRDRVVAEIGPPSPTRSSMLSDALLLDAFRQGWTNCGRQVQSLR
jgi:antitoxin (DNA-binding transcriptional repressor) of toxin-antitoxin stability system